jgi:hypothetical protein
MSEPTKTPSYPDSCPHCQNLTGWPVSAGTCDRPGVIVVKLRCQKCGREWIADAPKPVTAAVTSWLRRSDRRRDWPKLSVI